MTIARIKNLRLRTIIGTNESERKNKQDIVVNIRFEFDSREASKSDDLKDTANYRTITKNVIAAIEKSRFYLLERLADHLLGVIMKDKMVKRASVEIDKPGALRFAESVSLEMTAKR